MTRPIARNAMGITQSGVGMLESVPVVIEIILAPAFVIVEIVDAIVFGRAKNML
ncbi:MAG: hypothetical protein GWN13_09610 [Phycisphaerae bacterium]|nr:hypothetical protein [Phycisphaerae bacterium]